MTIFDNIKEYWGIIMFMVGLVFHALWVYFKVGENTGKIAKLEEQSKFVDTSIDKLNQSVASIDAKLDILLDGYRKNK